MEHEYAKIERWKGMAETIKRLWPHKTHDEILACFDDELARLDAFLAKSRDDPRKLEHFHRVARATIRGPEGATEDELVAALDDDYFWSVEETEALRKRYQVGVMRDAILYDRDRPRDDEE